MSGSVSARDQDLVKSKNKMDTRPWDDIPRLPERREPDVDRKTVRDAVEGGTATDSAGKSKKANKAKGSKDAKEKAIEIRSVRRRKAANQSSLNASCPSSSTTKDCKVYVWTEEFQILEGASGESETEGKDDDSDDKDG